MDLFGFAKTVGKNSMKLLSTSLISSNNFPEFLNASLTTKPIVFARNAGPVLRKIDIHTHILPKDIPAFKQKFGAFGLEVDPKPPTVAEMQQTLRKESQNVGALLSSINYKPE